MADARPLSGQVERQDFKAASRQNEIGINTAVGRSAISAGETPDTGRSMTRTDSNRTGTPMAAHFTL